MEYCWYGGVQWSLSQPDSIQNRLYDFWGDLIYFPLFGCLCLNCSSLSLLLWQISKLNPYFSVIRSLFNGKSFEAKEINEGNPKGFLLCLNLFLTFINFLTRTIHKLLVKVCAEAPHESRSSNLYSWSFRLPNPKNSMQKNWLVTFSNSKTTRVISQHNLSESELPARPKHFGRNRTKIDRILVSEWV